MSEPSFVKPSADVLKSLLTPVQYEVTQNAGTERPFTGEYWNVFDDGRYDCFVCGTHLFTSDTIFDAHCGWPSFYQAIESSRVSFI